MRFVRETRGRVRVPDHHETLWIRIRQRPKDDAVEDAEDGRARADAEPERQHRRHGKPGTSDQHPHAKPEILEKGVHFRLHWALELGRPHAPCWRSPDARPTARAYGLRAWR